MLKNVFGYVKKINKQQITILTLIIVIAFFVQMQFPLMLSGKNIEVLLMNFIFEGIIAIGMTLVIISGGIDLSVVAVFPLAEILVAKAMVEFGWSIPIAILLTLIACAVVGFINAFLINTLKVNPMVITVGVMMVLQGFNLSITDGASIYGFSDTFLALGQGKILGIKIPIIVFLLLAIGLGILLHRHKFFRQIYFIGGNEKAARLSGINVSYVKGVVYILCAVLTGVAGILGAAKFGTARWDHATNYHMKSISAVAIGGASMNGGSGNLGSTVLGVVFLALISNAFYMMSLNTFWYDVVNGGMLIVAVLFSTFTDYQRRKRIIKAKDELLK